MMSSILRQLTKYQQHDIGGTNKLPPEIIEVKQESHRYAEIVEQLCDVSDKVNRKRVINDALLALNNFNPPPMVDQLYPVELAILYHLFYHHKILLCSESCADATYGTFLKAVTKRDGSLDIYMRILYNCLDRNSASIFLYRVMLAALGDRGKWDMKRDHLNREFGLKAARLLGVEATARAAGRGLDGLATANVEQLILGRITYIAFWEWSQTKPIIESNNYLALPEHKSTMTSADIRALNPSRRPLVALPPHRP